VPNAGHAAEVVNQFIAAAGKVLAGEHPANMILLRGFSRYPHLPHLTEIYGVRAAVIAVPIAIAVSIAAPALLRAYACAPVWRVIAGVLVATSGASLPVILVIGLWASTPVPLAAWVRALVAFAAAPALLAGLINRAVAVEVEVRPGELVLRRRRLRFEIPCEAIARIRPWVVPLPGPGFSVWMRSGRRLYYGLHTAEIGHLLAALADIGEVDAARALIGHPSVVYAQVP
jgi:hypothetical protein